LHFGIAFCNATTPAAAVLPTSGGAAEVVESKPESVGTILEQFLILATCRDVKHQVE